MVDLDRRLSLECGPLGAEKLHARLESLLGAAIDRPADDLHVTVLHIGKPQELFAEISAELYLDRDAFSAELSETCEALTAASAQSYAAYATEFRVLHGVRADHLTLLISPSPELAALRARAELELFTLIRRLGVRYADQFIANSQAISVPAGGGWLPHITLASGIATPIELRATTAQFPIKLGPLKIHA